MRIPILVLTLAAAQPALASDVVDTRITFTLADDDILRGPTTSTVGSPSIPNFIAGRQNNLFYDNYERRDTGFENLTHLVLYTHKPGFFAGLDTEAALVLRAEYLTEGGVRLQSDNVFLSDDGSYIRLSKELETGRLSLTTFPITAQRFALGYSYDISWGGRGIFIGNRLSPGFKLQYDTDSAYGFLGAKTGLAQQIQTDGTVERDTVWGVLAGGGIDAVDELRIDFGGGYFRRGYIDKQDLRPPDGDGGFKRAPQDAFGVSAQVTYHVGMPIAVPIDFRLYRNDPLRRQDFFKMEEYDGLTSFLVTAETSVLGQTLQDPDRETSTVVQPAIAGDFAIRVKTGYWRFNLLAVYRDLAYLLFNVPSFPPFVDFPSGIVAAPELMGFVGADYHFPEWYLTPGLSFGVQRPAHIRRASDDRNIRTFVFKDEGSNVSLLNPGSDVALIYAGKFTFKWDLSEDIAAVGEFQGAYDQNRTELSQDLFGIANYVQSDPLLLGFNLMLQARF